MTGYSIKELDKVLNLISVFKHIHNKCFVCNERIKKIFKVISIANINNNCICITYDEFKQQQNNENMLAIFLNEKIEVISYDESII